ncbi:MAG: nodulation protein NfeD [Deltaproteobacteria bacterium]|nr:nodulation protein NfeD [Deltaproteobacteria bacterium]
MRYIHIILVLSISLFCCSGNGFTAENEVYIIQMSGPISPAASGFLKKGITKASDERVSCIIIELDTPGGLAESMREIVMAIFASKIPVVIYVAPSGARAASAGVMITMAADIAAMAPGTNIGAAHPVGAGGKEIGGVMSEKVTNDMVANARSIAQKRGRNADWVERAIRKSVSVTETEALKANVIDIVAKDIDDLIHQINGRKIQDKGVLKLENVKKILLKEDLRTKILKTISNPNIAYILMMIGLAGLYFELSHPGAVLPGVVGGISIILAFFAFQTIPVNYAGFLLIVLALIFFIMEMKIASYGLLSIAGIISLLLGSIMLFENSGNGMGLSWEVLIPTLVLISGFFVVVSGFVFKSHLHKPRTGARGMVGEIGVVREALMPEGKVFVHGELWRAISNDPIQTGDRVRVVKIVNLVLEVEPVERSI